MSRYSLWFVASRVLEAAANFLLLFSLKSNQSETNATQIVALGLYSLYSVFESGIATNLSRISAAFSIDGSYLTRRLIWKLMAVATVLVSVQLLLGAAIFRTDNVPISLWFVICLSLVNTLTIPSRSAVEKTEQVIPVYLTSSTANGALILIELTSIIKETISTDRLLWAWILIRLLPSLMAVSLSFSKKTGLAATTKTPFAEGNVIQEIQSLSVAYPAILLSSIAGYLAYQSLGPILALSTNVENAAQMVYELQFFQVPFAFGCLTINAEINERIRRQGNVQTALDNSSIRKAQVMSLTTAILMIGAATLLQNRPSTSASQFNILIFSLYAMAMQRTHYQTARLRLEKYETMSKTIYIHSLLVVAAAVVGSALDSLVVVSITFVLTGVSYTRHSTDRAYKAAFQGTN